VSKYLIITGGSHGIGEKTAELFSHKGWQVINISRSNCAVKNVTNFNADLATSDWSQSLTEKLKSEVSNASQICVVHNAAAFMNDNVMNLASNSLRSVMNVNLISAVELNQILHPHMKFGSSIVYVGTTLAEQAVPNRASYVISKHAVVGLMRATCQDLAGQGIHTCCVCPGFVNTKMLTEGLDIAMLNQFVETKVTAKRLIEPEEIADFIYYCAEHPIVNGSVLHTNLGQVMN
jgi:NAD(P)-dependent dehydrogenase (short-subunit alcohol dehydrogenase family)